MDDRGQFTAALLDSGTKAYAAGAVSRLQDDPEAQNLLDSFGFESLVADTEIRLRCLAEALATGRPELFQHDVMWLEATYQARQVPTSLIRIVLQALRDELESSLPPGSGESIARCFDLAFEGLGRGSTPVETFLEDGLPRVELARRFLLALLEGRRQEALDEGVPILDLHQHVITRVQAEVGRMWQAGELHVAEEHMGSRIVEEVLVVLRRRIPRNGNTGKTVIVASVPGNLHDIGARMVADHFEIAGWDSIFLGADTPTNALVRAIGDFEADLVALSSGIGMNVRSTAEMVGAIHAASDVPVIVGGMPFLAVPDLWKDVGANGSAADPAEAVRVAENLVGN